MKGRSGSSALAALGVAVACGPLTAPPGSIAPVNVCPDNPCSAYVQAGATPVCNGGRCLVSAQIADLWLVVSLPTDSYFAPGRTFAVSFDHLFDPSPTILCAPPACTHLPPDGLVRGYYLAKEADQRLAHWNLGNGGGSGLTALPVHVTYRPLWPPDSSPASAVDATSAGLPLEMLQASAILDNQSVNRPPGPAGGPTVEFAAYMQPSLYEATLTPDPPFDVAYPPDIKRVTIGADSQIDLDGIAFDTTKITESSGEQVIPTFDLARVAGLQGWTAYLRDQTTRRRISPVATLSGTATNGVVLPTNHHPSDGDALTNTALVLAPPAGQPIPSGIFTPTGKVLPRQEIYSPLPAPAMVSGAITSSVDGAPVEADLIFESSGIYVAGSALPNTTNFEYLGRASARIDPARGVSTYSVALPRGLYRLTVRPLTTDAAVTVVDPLVVKADPVIQELTVDPLQPVSGSVVVSDGRPLAGATVEAVPVQCAKGTSTWCLPRPGRTTTLADGSFMMTLDLGTYVLRAEPVDGTRLPWVVQTIVVGPAQSPLPPMTVPAPVYAGVQLHDVGDNPIVDAVVRIFAVPPQAGQTGQPGAVEVGRAITDKTGHYDVYLDPSAE